MKSHSIAKNTTFMTFASVGQKIVAFAYFTIIANIIGVESLGTYFTALAFTTVFVVFVDLGFTNVLVREAAKAKDRLQEYMSTLLFIKMILAIFTYVALIITVHLLGYDVELRHMIYLSGVTMLFDSLHLTLYGSLRAIGNLKYEAISIVASQLLTLILGSIFLFLHLPLIFLILAFTVSSVLNVLFVLYILSVHYKMTLRMKYDPVIFRHLGKIVIPFAFAAVFARVYSYIDSLLLKQLAGDIAVGWYAIPYKITYAFQFIPLALVAAMYPRFSEYFVSNKERLAYIFQQGMKYLFIISFPVATGIAILSEDIILFLYTEEYTNSILPLRILIGSLIFSYISFPIGAFLNACNKQVTQTVIVGIVMIINIILNLTLIPLYGVVGAASSAFVGNVLLAALGYIIIPRVITVSHQFLLKTVLQVACAASVMGYVVWYINNLTHFVFAILAGIIIYPSILFLVRAVNKRQLTEAFLLVKK